jgi:hypothetical protein
MANPCSQANLGRDGKQFHPHSSVLFCIVAIFILKAFLKSFFWLSFSTFPATEKTNKPKTTK